MCVDPEYRAISSCCIQISGPLPKKEDPTDDLLEDTRAIQKKVSGICLDYIGGKVSHTN